MGIRLFQLLIIGLVLSANVHWEITPNPYLASLIGVFIALIVSSLMVTLHRRIQGRM